MMVIPVVVCLLAVLGGGSTQGLDDSRARVETEREAVTERLIGEGYSTTFGYSFFPKAHGERVVRPFLASADRDGYDAQDEALVFRLFGPTPVDRWPAAEALYDDAGCDARFTLYPGVGHQVTPAMLDDMVEFFLAEDSR